MKRLCFLPENADERHREYLKADLSMQRVVQEKTEMQLRALQSQINPPFLFIGLKTLSLLIDEDPNQAGEFVDELSKVYQYLLRSQ